jgi:hypothetical protein
MASADGLSRVPCTGADKNELTVGGELDKLASNIAIGRDHAGVHWRSDYTESLKLGESIAITFLEDSGFVYNEDFKGFSLLSLTVRPSSSARKGRREVGLNPEP